MDIGFFMGRTEHKKGIRTMANAERLKRGIIQSPTNGIKTIFEEFIRLEASGGILLMLSAALALAWANSPWADSYTALWDTRLTVGVGAWQLSKPLLLWINDGLMAMFFFVVGLEIKREVLTGKLASARRAALPMAAALGGMLVPAGVYALVNAGSPGIVGWGIPMATDIAFTLGVLALLGTRAPLALKVFVTALAIVDDIGAVLVIALFYTSEIAWFSLLIGAFLLVGLFALNRMKVKSPLPYAILGVGLWLAFLYSGVHATIAGVLLAMTIPARGHGDRQAILAAARVALDDYERAIADEAVNGVSKRQAAAWALDVASEKAESLLQRLEHTLHPWVVYVIMPVFALANAGVAFGGEGLAGAVARPVMLGIALGLVVGKPLGISLFAWIAVRLGLAELPPDVTLRHVVGAGFLAGIGFTMSLFVANLAFAGDALLDAAKLGILLASLAAGAAGWALIATMPGPGGEIEAAGVGD
jgi:NhaA family Na+:H+ antiporter